MIWHVRRGTEFADGVLDCGCGLRDDTAWCLIGTILVEDIHLTAGGRTCHVLLLGCGVYCQVDPFQLIGLSLTAPHRQSS